MQAGGQAAPHFLAYKWNFFRFADDCLKTRGSNRRGRQLDSAAPLGGAVFDQACPSFQLWYNRGKLLAARADREGDECLC